MCVEGGAWLALPSPCVCVCVTVCVIGGEVVCMCGIIVMLKEVHSELCHDPVCVRGRVCVVPLCVSGGHDHVCVC